MKEYIILLCAVAVIEALCEALVSPGPMKNMVMVGVRLAISYAIIIPVTKLIFGLF